MLRDRRSERCAEIRIGGSYRRCAVSNAFRWDRDLGSGIRVLVLRVSAVGSGQRCGCWGRRIEEGLGLGSGPALPPAGRAAPGWVLGPSPALPLPLRRVRGWVAPELRARSCLWPWGARGCRCWARQEDGASLEQTLDRGWKKAGRGDRPAPGPTGSAAPSAPPPAPPPGFPLADPGPPRGDTEPPAPVTLRPPRSLPASPGNLCRTSGAAAPGRPLGPAPAVPGVGLEEARSPRKGCSEQAHGDASARTETTDSPEGPEEQLAPSGNGGTGPFAEGLRQQFLILASKSSHTAARYVLTTPNLFPPFLSEAAVHQQHLS
ncbi:translation initiation factor IF-2-like isoform X2 [Pyrgilauda ruficollis]|uniref:translation initiation factor IF-2-like isoform X2 n=1 Tax=Pyrgilauda ruficollis TaxID=221976 RepID=UPI001B866CC0|nr:translation initiation factor IF-2-like isoform X2 [Pyrgilauda ruficollis]